jgi:hypothetical protein
MSAKSANRLIDHLMSGLEDIIGIAGKHSIREKFAEILIHFIQSIDNPINIILE